MGSFKYAFGTTVLLNEMFPPADLANASVNLTDRESVIAHYTTNSLVADGFVSAKASVTEADGQYWIEFSAQQPQT